MKVTTHRYGVEEHMEVEDADVFAFNPGLSGFDHYTRYAVLRDEDSPVEWLQSLENPELAFAMIEPFLFYPEYGFDLPDRDCEDLGLSRPQDAMVRCLLTLSAVAEGITANLMAPIILNRQAGRGRQVVLQESNLPLRFPVLETMQVPLSA